MAETRSRVLVGKLFENTYWMIGLFTIKIWPTFWIQSPNLQFLALLTTISQNHRALNVLSRLYTILMTIHILLPSLRKIAYHLCKMTTKYLHSAQLMPNCFFFFISSVQLTEQITRNGSITARAKGFLSEEVWVFCLHQRSTYTRASSRIPSYLAMHRFPGVT